MLQNSRLMSKNSSRVSLSSSSFYIKKKRQQSDDMDLFESSYYRLNKRQLFYLGLWPLQTPKERYFYRTIAVILLGSIILPEVIKFFECWGNLKAMIECTPILGIHFRCIVKFLNSHLNSKKLRKLTLRIEDDWTRKFGETDEKILRAYAQRGRLLTVGYTVYLYIALTSFLAMPMIPVVLDIVAPLNLSRDRINLFEAEYFVDQDEIFFYMMIHACITWTIGTNIIIACDTMNAVFVQHICGSFARLGSRLQRIGGYVQKNNKLSMSQNDCEITNAEYEEIVTCIKMHNEAIRLFKLLEDASCISLLFIVGSGMLSAIASGFTAVTNLDKRTEVFRYTVVIIGELIHLLFIFWQGQTLLEHSQDIFFNAYNVDWNDISPRARRLLIMIMIRSWKPCNLTAGKVIVLTMENYSSALKTMMSYFTVLLSMQ